MVEINDLSMHFPIRKTYKDHILKPFQNDKFLALDSINLKIDSNDKVAFMGINGAGKTTLLKLIGGILYPSKGKIFVNGLDTNTQNIEARGQVGFVLNDDRSFYWRLTGLQNLEFFGSLDNLNIRDLKTRVNKLIEVVGLHDSAHKMVGTYSSGMKQRLSIARGLLCDPKLLILDEPTKALDPGAVEDMNNLMAERIHEEKDRSLLIATHNFAEVETLCNKIIIIKKGKIVSYETIDYVKSEFKTISRYYHLMVNSKI